MNHIYLDLATVRVETFHPLGARLAESGTGIDTTCEPSTPAYGCGGGGGDPEPSADGVSCDIACQTFE